MKRKGKCIICGKRIDNDLSYCDECKIDLEIKQTEAQMEM